ncbi:MAG: 50S ribosomal protein L4 [Gammaproteobacteria bacterium]|nr:MAG: 50S ribosomal protein L4 [Gammaproteobacteria bacterium]
MELTLHSTTGGQGSVNLADGVFGVDFNEPLIHQVVTAYLAGARAGTKAQKNRSAVSGGGRKPWRQKGTGRARAGTIRSPLWRGGGKTFAATPRDHSVKVNRKMYRGAIRSILSELVRQERLMVIDDLAVEQPRTRLLAEQLGKLGLEKALIVTDQVDENLYLAARNIPGIDVCEIGTVDPVSLVGADKVVFTEKAIKQLEGQLQ